jgi:AraC-like DNA-binding protein
MGWERKPAWESLCTVIEPQINADGVHEWPFDPMFPIDVRHFRLEGYDDIRMNRHRYLELVYVHSGETHCEIQGRCFVANPGDLLVIGKDCFHHVFDPHRRPMNLVVLYFQPELIADAQAYDENLEYLMPFLVQDSKPAPLVPASGGIPAQVLDFMLRIDSELPPRSIRARISVKTYLQYILVLLVKHYARFSDGHEDLNDRERHLERLRPLFDWINAHYRGPIGVEDGASLVHMSTARFMSYFKKVTGQSFLSYLNRFRIARAQSLLTWTDCSIAEVGQATGFCNQSYFALAFRKLVGITPREYKNRIIQSADWPESQAARRTQFRDPLQSIAACAVERQPGRSSPLAQAAAPNARHQNRTIVLR